MEYNNLQPSPKAGPRGDQPELGSLSEQTLQVPHNFASLWEKFTEQQQLISLMQVQIDLQNEKLASHDKLIQNLTDQIKKLETASQTKSEKDTKPPSSQKGNDWTASGDISVAEMVKQAAEETITSQAITNYVFDENTGLYFDAVSGYYYDPVQELFYNGHTKTYYKFDATSQTYVFHSQVSENVSKRKKKRQKVKTKDDKKIMISKSDEINSAPCSPSSENLHSDSSNKKTSDIEEGELSDSTIESKNDSDESDCTIVSSRSTTDSDLKEMNIPCIRAVITESSLSSLPKGFLFIVTCMGGSIGCDGSMHSILLPDPEAVSQNHAEIFYSSEEGKYFLTDLGSETGTFLNGNRLSETKVKSDPHTILHGSMLKIGETTLLLHVHPGSFTCGHCEPGLNITKEPLYGSPVSKSKKEKMRKQQLKMLKQKYGVEKDPTNVLSKLPDSYKDRASERRILKGSDNPFEKTAVASVDESITQDNKGFKMMAKMGWKAGTSLGSSTPGIVEPIKIEVRSARSGLGSSQTEESFLGVKSSPKPKGQKDMKLDQTKIKAKTLKRFKESLEKGNGGMNENEAASMDSFQE